MTIEVVNMIDNPDGSCDIDVQLDYETILKLAKIGLEHLLKNAAERAVKSNDDPAGISVSKDGSAGEP